MKRILLSLLSACGLLTGCITRPPFPEPEPFALDNDPASAIPGRFTARLAPAFEQVNAVRFRFNFHELTTLGMLAVNRPERSFSVSCMTPLGVKLFDVVCRRGRIESRFVHPEIAKRGGDLAQAAGADLTHAYFDWQPPPGSPYVLKDGRLVFSVPDAVGTTEYRYAGHDGRLAEKIRFENGRRLWTVAYRNYAARPEGLVPTALVITNHTYGYRLVVSVREENG